MTGFWVLLCVLCLVAYAYCETRRINRRAENWRAIEDERRAREASKPNGHVDVWGWPR